jgi:glutamyl-tRNA synthetase
VSMPQRPVRTRIAPSPTGYFHLGTARTALYNWLFAHQHSGQFLLRIEDTDTERNREEWVEGICRALDWLGLHWDEGPYRQSERTELYKTAASRLFEAGFAYYCDCTRQDLEARHPDAAGQLRYDSWCRERGLGPGEGRALRFVVPKEGETRISDLVRGEVVFPNRDIEDFVLMRSNGTPLFILSNTLDDFDMAISHVIRGEEHLPNTPKYRLVWEALSRATEADHPLPQFAHLPLLVNASRQKLSKRRDPVALENYIASGYLREALINHLALLGWGPEEGDDVLSIEDLLERFSLERVNPSPAYFDPAKLRHFNGIWIRRMSREAFVEAALCFLEQGPWPKERFSRAAFERIAPLVQERVATLQEVVGMVDFLFLEDPPQDKDSWAALKKDDRSALVLKEAAFRLRQLGEWEAKAIEATLRIMAEELGLPLRVAQAPVRIATTGRRVGPPLFESLEVLGQTETVRRLEAARSRLQENEE